MPPAEDEDAPPSTPKQNKRASLTSVYTNQSTPRTHSASSIATSMVPLPSTPSTISSVRTAPPSPNSSPINSSAPRTPSKQQQKQPSSSTTPSSISFTPSRSSSVITTAGPVSPRTPVTTHTATSVATNGTVIPPSSSKKNVKIVLSANRIKSFDRFDRDTVSITTNELLLKPSPKSSLIKKKSLEFFMKFNKNGKELAQRQELLLKQMNQAANNSGKEEEEVEEKTQIITLPTPTKSNANNINKFKSTPSSSNKLTSSNKSHNQGNDSNVSSPRTGRARASDYFFKE
jgi:hypothetical protein